MFILLYSPRIYHVLAVESEVNLFLTCWRSWWSFCIVELSHECASGSSKRWSRTSSGLCSHTSSAFLSHLHLFNNYLRSHQNWRESPSTCSKPYQSHQSTDRPISCSPPCSSLPDSMTISSQILSAPSSHSRSYSCALPLWSSWEFWSKPIPAEFGSAWSET